MPLSLFAFSAALASSGQAQPPQTYIVPPSALAGLGREEGLQVDGRIVPGRRRSNVSTSPNEVVVCGDNGAQQQTGPVNAEWERRYGHRPEGPAAGAQFAPTAMEASRCAVVRCPARGMIDVIGVGRAVRRGLGRLFGGGD